MSSALLGGKGGESSKHQHYDVQQQGPCQYELQQFVECAQSQGDVTLCQGFSEVLKQCKIANNLS